MCIHISEIHIHALTDTSGHMPDRMLHFCHIRFVYHCPDKIQIICINILRDTIPVFLSLQN